MNAEYDSSAAAQAIGVLMHETLEGGNQEDVMHLSDVQTAAYSACAVEEPRSYRLTRRNSTDFFEAIFRVRGVMCQNNLPPVLEIRSGVPGHRLRQSVTLSALSNHIVFEKYLGAMREFHDLFKVTFPGEQFTMDCFYTYEGHRCIVLFNRYLSFRSDTPSTMQIPFDPQVDPAGLLRQHPHQNMHHVEDNRVSYSRREIHAGRESLKRISPTCFRNGDLIEVHFTFVAFPMKKGEPRRIGCVMHHLILLSDRLRKESEGVIMPLGMHPVIIRTLKRKQAIVESDPEAEGKDGGSDKHMRL
ncbi:hypothetical protein GALMADRAFT_225846 [Galerina marginata CBS 339.88]|uniref:Uncharacterized protein n=1 Tax=Galerina marginata (strain CBS 339.88) TaxID=685588 RepID=A0A067SYZ0_GALM3|nr:hypothetical protein GALMADRAFT_225846 [Galerina marginata CBS 339.88]